VSTGTPLIFNTQTGQHPSKCTSFASAQENTIMQWVFILNHFPAAVEIWNLNGLAWKVDVAQEGIQ